MIFISLNSCSENTPIPYNQNDKSSNLKSRVLISEYVDSVEKFIFYEQYDISKNGCEYEFKSFSDSIYDSRIKRTIDRNNKSNNCRYRLSCSKDTLFLTKMEGNFKLIKTDAINISLKGKKIEIFKYKFVRDSTFLENIESSTFYNLELGLIETIVNEPNTKQMRIRLQSISNLRDSELKELQRQLRKSRIYN
jgi:hypothetical protein